MALVIALAAAAVALAAPLGVLAERRLAWRLVTRRQVIVNLRNGAGVSGVLWARRGGLLVLRNAVLHSEGQEVRLDGEAVVERGEVAWLQVLPPAGD